MMKRKTAVIFGIIIAAQLCLTPYAGVKVQAAELEEGQMFEDSSEDSETFGDVSIPDTQSAEKTEENEFGDDDGFSDGDVETFSAEDADQFRENMQELVLNVQDGEDITVKLNTLLAQARDKATDEKQCKVIVPPGNYTLTGTLHMYSNIYLYAEGATITKTSPRKEILLRLGDTKKSAGGYEGYRNITIDGGTWDSNYECVEDKGGPGGFVGFRIGHATNVTVKNVTFLNNLKSHFLELAGVKNAEITGCTFRGYWKEFTGGGQECIQLDACMPRIFPGYLPYDGSVCENIVIKDNTFEDVFAGIGSHSMMFDKPYKNITISNNRFNNLKKRAIWCLNYQDTVVTGNTMTNVGGGVYVRSVYTRNAHTVSGQEVSPEGNQYAENILIADNQITVLEPTVIDGKQWNGYGIWITGEVSLGSAGETIPSEDDDPENTANPTTNGIPAGRYIIRGVTARNNTISGNCDGIKFSLAEDCSCRGNTVRLSDSHTYNNMGISVAKGSNIRVSYNNLSGGNGYGIYAVCDRITVLRNGELVGEYETKDLPRVMLVAKMMGKDFDDLADIKGDHKDKRITDAEPVIEAKGLSHKGTIKPFDITINKGEVIGLTGLLGSGRSELVRAIYGADKADTGTLKVKGKEVKINTPLDAMKLGMAYLPEDRKAEGIIADLSVRENIIIALQAKRGMFHPLSKKEMEDAADKYIKLLQIKTASRETPIKSLSGGNQQKVILGRWLLTNPDYLILDEPTRGIDIGTKTEIQKLVLDLADQGMAVTFISSEVEEMLRTCSRMAVLRDGQKVGELEEDELSQSGVMKAIAGGDDK